MEREPVTVLWIGDGASAKPPSISDTSIHVRTVHESVLESEVGEARKAGGVVVVCSPDKVDAALRLGVDEVATWASVDLRKIVERARTRALWRVSHEANSTRELPGLALLGAAMGHELRNPLTAAMLNCHLIQSAVVEEHTNEVVLTQIPAEDVRGAIDDLGIALRDIANVVERMIALTQPGDVATCDLSRVLVELAASAHRDVSRVADFVVEIPNKPCVVSMPRSHATQIVASLLANAIQAVERGKNRPGAISLRLMVDGGVIVVEVADNGIGMSSDTRRQALNPFYTSNRPNALGMGLTFAALHTRRAGGELLVDSEIGHGTHVRMFLPGVFPDAAVRPSAN